MYRVGQRNIHYSINVEDIKETLKDKGPFVNQIMNVLNRQTEEPKNLLFIDLERKSNDNNVYNYLVKCCREL